jgi:aspartate racemase
MEEETSVPLIHITVAAARQIKKQNLRTVGLRATKYTMEMDFYKRKLNEANIEVLIPELRKESSFTARLLTNFSRKCSRKKVKQDSSR